MTNFKMGDGEAQYITHTSHTSHRAAKLYSGVQRIDCKTRRRKGRALKEKLRQAQHNTVSTEREPWLTEVVSVNEVDIIEPSVLVHIEEVYSGSDEKQTLPSVLPLLQTKFPHATEQDAKLIAPLFDSSKSTVTLSSETPLKYLIIPLLLGASKLMIFVSSSVTRRESFLYNVNTRRQTNESQKSYGIHWGYEFKSFSEYVPFTNVSYYYSTERIETYRRALWKNISRAMVTMIDEDLISAIAISYQDFLSGTFHHFFSILKSTLYQLFLDWDLRFKDIALERASILYKHIKQIVVIERVQVTNYNMYAHLELRKIYAKTFSEGVHRFTKDKNMIEKSSTLCVTDSQHILYPNKNTNTVENGLLCVYLHSLMNTQSIEHLSLSTDHEPFDLSKIDTMLIDCIAIPVQAIIDNLCLYCGVSMLIGLKSVIQIVSPNTVLQHIQRVVTRSLVTSLYGSLITNLLLSQIQTTNSNQNDNRNGDFIIFSFKRLRSQLIFLTGLMCPPLEPSLWWDSIFDISGYMGLCLQSFGEESYTYKLLGSMKQSNIERKYPVCKWVKQACDLEDTPERFSISTLLCILSNSMPDGIPLDYINLQHHLATIHDTESHVVCYPRYNELPPCIVFIKTPAKDCNHATVCDWHLSKTVANLKADLDSLLTELVENHDKDFRASVLSTYSTFKNSIDTYPLVDAWEKRVSALQQSTGTEYNPVAACLALLADDSLSSTQFYASITLKISLQNFASCTTDHYNMFTKTARNISEAIDHFFVRLNI